MSSEQYVPDYQIHNTPKSWYYAAPLPYNYIEPTSHGRAPYAPKPYDLYIDSDTARKQEAINMAFESLFDYPYPADVPQEFREMVATDYMAGRAMRTTENAANYYEWLRRGGEDELTTPRLRELRDKALYGRADVHELLELLHATSMKSTGLAELTVPYGYRLHHVRDMRDSVQEAVEDMGGKYFLGKIPYRNHHVSTHFSPTGELVGAVATYKRNIGLIPCSTERMIRVVERQAVGIRVDPDSGFDQQFKQAIEQHFANNSPHYPAMIEQLQRHLSYAETAKYIVPLSASIYAFETIVAHPERLAALRRIGDIAQR